MGDIFKKAYDLFTTGLADLIKELRKDKADLIKEMNRTPEAINQANNRLVEQIENINNQEGIKPLLIEIISTLKSEVQKFDKKVVIENDNREIAKSFQGVKYDLLRALKDIEKKLPKSEKPEDYTSLLKNIAGQIPSNKDLKGLISEVDKALKRKFSVELPKELVEDKRVKVLLSDKQLDKLKTNGGGSYNYPAFTGTVKLFDKDRTTINPATEDKQDNIITELQKTRGFDIPAYDTQIINEADPDNVVITYKLSGATVATKTISVSGTTTTISVT